MSSLIEEISEFPVFQIGCPGEKPQNYSSKLETKKTLSGTTYNTDITAQPLHNVW